MVEFYTRYAPPKSPIADSSKPSLTQQEFKESCDINNILAKFSVQAQALGVSISQLMPQDQGGCAVYPDAFPPSPAPMLGYSMTFTLNLCSAKKALPGYWHKQRKNGAKKTPLPA